MSALMLERSVQPGCRVRPVGRIGRSTRPTRPGAPPLPRNQSVRLTRRGRLVLVGLLAAVLVALTVGWGAARAGVAATDTPQRSVTVIVARGDTLWSIADDVDPGADRRQVIDRIIRANHLDGARIEPGQRLVVPTPGSSR